MLCSGALLFLLFPALSVAGGSSTAAPPDGPSPPRALQMLRPQALGPGQKELKGTDYFDPRTYTSRDLAKLMNGLVQQIGKDLDKANEELSEQAEKNAQLEGRIALLESAQLPIDERTLLVVTGSALLLVALTAALLGVHLLFGQQRKAALQMKHKRLVDCESA